MSCLEISRTDAGTVYPTTVRLDVKLSEPKDFNYNSVSYVKLLNLELGKDIISLDLINLTTEDTHDRFKDYEEESYIDNTEVYRDTFPAGKEPALGGFYVNTGKLRMKSSLSVPNSRNENKIYNKKKISYKNKSDKIIRTKESTKAKVKNMKHEKTRISMHHKINSNIRLDALLKTVLKQKKNGIVKSINIPNTSEHSSVARASKKAKKICKMNTMKNFHSNSSKEHCIETSVATKMMLNSTEVTIPKEDFLSSKTSPFHSSNSTSDADEVQILKEVLHSMRKNNNEHILVKDNQTLQTEMASESVRIATSKALHSPATIISKEMPNLFLNSNAVLSNPILETRKPSLNSCPTTIPKRAFHSSSLIAFEPDFIPAVPLLKPTKPLKLPRAILPKNINSNCKGITDSVKAINCSGPNRAIHSSLSKTTIATVDSSSSKGTVKKIRSRSSKANVPKEEFHSYSQSTAKYAQDIPLVKSEKVGCMETIKPVHSISPKSNTKHAHSKPSTAVTNLVHSRSSKSLTKSAHSNPSTEVTNIVHSGTSKALTTSVFKTTTKPTDSSSFNSIAPVNSSSSKVKILYSSRKIANDSAFIDNSQMLNMNENTGSSKVTIQKDKPNLSCITEVSRFQNMPPMVSAESNFANNTDSCSANLWNNLKMNSTNPKTVSKYMLQLIHADGASSSPNSISVFPSNSQSNAYFNENSLVSEENFTRTYSKADKSLFQPYSVVQTDPLANSSFAVSQMKQANVMNTLPSSSNKNVVDMNRMDISPIVKYKEPRRKI